MLVYKMNQLLLLAGLVLVLYVMNEKKVFSGLSKTLSSGKNNTMLVLVFCGVILFMCMQKGKVMEYFSLLEENSNNCGPGKKKCIFTNQKMLLIHKNIYKYVLKE